MKRFALALSMFAFSAAAASADGHLTGDDAVDTRKALMQGVGAAAGLAGAMMKGEMDYDPAVAKSVIATMRGAAYAVGAFFPEGADSVKGTTASANIWEDAGGFANAVAKFKADIEAAMAASGRDGPADLQAFRAAIGPVFANCRSCHEGYRVKN